MADMYDCGVYHFNSWSEGRPFNPSTGRCCWYPCLGDFDATMTADEAANRLDIRGGVEQFLRGWEDARARYMSSQACEA